MVGHALSVSDARARTRRDAYQHLAAGDRRAHDLRRGFQRARAVRVLGARRGMVGDRDLIGDPHRAALPERLQRLREDRLRRPAGSVVERRRTGVRVRLSRTPWRLVGHGPFVRDAAVPIQRLQRRRHSSRWAGDRRDPSHDLLPRRPRSKSPVRLPRANAGVDRDAAPDRLQSPARSRRACRPRQHDLRLKCHADTSLQDAARQTWRGQQFADRAGHRSPQTQPRASPRLRTRRASIR